MNRYDALAPPLFDVVTTKADPAPFDVVHRGIPDTINTQSAPGGGYSERMDFRGPNRNPDLGAVLWWERKGAPPPGSRIAAEVRRGAPPTVTVVDPEDSRVIALEEAGRLAFEQYLAAHPEIHPDFRSGAAAPKVRPIDTD